MIDSLRALIRLLLFIFLASSYILVSLWIHLVARDEFERRKRFSENAHAYCKSMCRLIGLKVTVKNLPPANKVGMLVGNHMGFADIFSIASLMPSLFVTSQEMHQTPFIGLITEFAGCVYVDRKNKSNILKELDDMVEYLRLGFRVVLYPEATSHNGEVILPFKRTLIMAAAYAGVPLIPFVFNFKKINGEPFTKKYQDSVCFYGDIPFLTSMWNMIKLKQIECEVEFLPDVIITPDHNRAAVADSVRQMIVEKFEPLQMNPAN